MFQLKDSYGAVLSYQPCYFIQVFKRLNKAHPHWGGQVALLSLLIQMPVSSKTPSQKHPE